MNNAIDNSGLKDFCKSCNCDAFAPAITFTYDATAHTIVVKEASTYPSGDAIGKTTVTIIDIATGKTVQQQITALGVPGQKTFDVSTFSGTDGFNIIATAVTNKKCIATLGAYQIPAIANGTGSLSHINKS